MQPGLRTDRTGAAALEFALVFPVFLMFVFGLFAAYSLISCRRAMDYGIERALRYATVHGGGGVAGVTAAYVAAAGVVWPAVGANSVVTVTPGGFKAGDTVLVSVSYGWTAPAGLRPPDSTTLFTSVTLNASGSIRITSPQRHPWHVLCSAAGVPARMLEHAQRTGRDVGSYMLYMIIADDTDGAAMAKWDLYNRGADKDALVHLLGKAAEDTAPSDTSMAAANLRAPSPINFNMGTLVGAYGRVASMLDEVAAMPGVKGIMLTFDDFLLGMDAFGDRIQPLMRCRADRMLAA